MVALENEYTQIYQELHHLFLSASAIEAENQ